MRLSNDLTQSHGGAAGRKILSTLTWKMEELAFRWWRGFLFQLLAGTGVDLRIRRSLMSMRDRERNVFDPSF